MEKEVAVKGNMISIAKGIGIILMVIGHSGCPSYMRNFIYMFHMPLFFIISGYCFKSYYLYNFKLFAKKKFIGLYLPFVKYSALFLILHNLFYKIGIYNSEFGRGISGVYYSLDTILTHFLQIFLLINYEPLISPLWFVASLFIGFFAFYFSSRYIQNDYNCGIFLFIITLALIPFAKSSHPIVFRSAFASLYLWVGGFLSKRFSDLNRVYIIIISIVIVSLGSIFFPTEMPKVDYNMLIPYFLCSVFGSIMLLIICDRIKYLKSNTVRLLEYLGNHTMTILIWHFLCFKVVSILIVLLRGGCVLEIAKFPTLYENAPNPYWTIYTIIGITIPLLIEKVKSVFNY